MKYFHLGWVLIVVASCHGKTDDGRVSCCAREQAATEVALALPTAGPGSVYELPGVWTDQRDRRVALSELRGRTQFVAMIFTHCSYVCPRVVERMKALVDSLPPAQKGMVGCVLVTFDPERDTPARLRQFAMQMGLDSRWELLRGDEEQIRALAMVLNVRYEKLGDGNYNHTSEIIELDKEGKILASR
jgi:protein SCO1